MLRSVGSAFLFLLLAAAAGCSSQDDKSPYVEMRGGGFIFNYRIAEATEGFFVVVLRPLPGGATLEASFENPAGGEAILVTAPASANRDKFDFITPPLKGIVADKEYRVALRVLAADGKELQRIEKKFHSQVDQSILPEKPLTIGPGYTKNPDLAPAPGSGAQ